jgi:hypothetical protein
MAGSGTGVAFDSCTVYVGNTNGPQTGAITCQIKSSLPIHEQDHYYYHPLVPFDYSLYMRTTTSLHVPL